MPTPDQYVAILRCQTWNVWPEKTVLEHKSFPIAYDATDALPTRIAILSYINRSTPERYLKEETKVGPLLWDGETPGLHRVRDAVLKAPEDEVEIAWRHRNVHRGEVDICINFRFEGELLPSLLDALRTTASAIMSLVNLQFKDFLTPAAPFQIRKVLPEGGDSVTSTALLAVHARHSLKKEELDSTLTGIASVLLHSVYGQKLRVALELYAAHFNEEQVRVRFLLLVIALESLAKATRKHEVAVSLLQRWKRELEVELQTYANTSEEFQSLEALSRELSFRSDDSIRSQVRKLFADLLDTTPSESNDLQRRALRVYDKRSVLVHDGQLPNEELTTLESEARELLETVFTDAIARVQNASRT